MKGLPKEISVKLKHLFQILLAASLLSTSTTACTSGPVLREPPEIWLIDQANLELYRVLSEQAEQAIPIKNNKEMYKFMCIDERELSKVYKNLRK